MKGEFEVKVVLRLLPLSRASINALRHLERYDVIVFTSKNAKLFFDRELKLRRFAPPRIRTIRVGPRNDLLKFDFKGKRILFPRSAKAPADIVRKLRAKGAVIRVIPLYVPNVPRLAKAERRRLLDGEIKQLYFKSPSGIQGLLAQFRGNGLKSVLALRVRCIGATTAHAAREAGFKRVFTKMTTVL